MSNYLDGYIFTVMLQVVKRSGFNKKGKGLIHKKNIYFPLAKLL